MTNFLYGQEGQELCVLGDGFTSVVHGTPIKTSTGATKLLAANKTYRFTLFGGVWVEQDAGISYTNPYVGKHVTLFGGAPVTHATSGTYDWFPSNVNSYVSVQDLTGMTQFRLLYVAKSSSAATGIIAKPAYSSDGSSWTDFTAMSTFTPSTSAPSFSSSAWTSLPGGAQIATAWLGIKFKGDSNMDIYAISFEFKP